MGMSAETFWDGREGAEELKARMTAHCGVGVSMGSDASQAAIRRYGDVRRIAVLTPYMPVGDANVGRFFTESGFEVLAVEGLKCPTPTSIADVRPERLIDACRRLDGPDVECIIQVGTNLPFARLAPEAERWLGKPVLAINTCIYWHALRANGIEDRIDGFGSLLLEH
jgi:maleate isomerase